MGRRAHQYAYQDSREHKRRTKPMPNHEGSRLRKRQDILCGTREGPDSRGRGEYEYVSESVLHHVLTATAVVRNATGTEYCGSHHVSVFVRVLSVNP